MSGGHKWRPAQRAKFIATMRARRGEVKKADLKYAGGTMPNDKSQPEQLIYHGALYRRVQRIKVIR